MACDKQRLRGVMEEMLQACSPRDAVGATAMGWGRRSNFNPNTIPMDSYDPEYLGSDPEQTKRQEG